MRFQLSSFGGPSQKGFKATHSGTNDRLFLMLCTRTSCSTKYPPELKDLRNNNLSDVSWRCPAVWVAKVCALRFFFCAQRMGDSSYNIRRCFEVARSAVEVTQTDLTIPCDSSAPAPPPPPYFDARPTWCPVCWRELSST